MVWYATSSVATISSRIILHGGVVRPQDLLVTQLVLSLAYLHLLGILGIVDLKISKEHISALKHFLLSISVVYVTGFLLLQKCARRIMLMRASLVYITFLTSHVLSMFVKVFRLKTY